MNSMRIFRSNIMYVKQVIDQPICYLLSHAFWLGLQSHLYRNLNSVTMQIENGQRRKQNGFNLLCRYKKAY